MTDQSLKRVLQTLDLLDREIQGLNRTRERLFRQGPIDADWVKGIAHDPSREDMIESFAAKFNRLQDTIGDKLLPRYFQWRGERPLPFLDNLQRAEKLGLIQRVDTWLQARALRNKLVHEYVNDPQEFANAINQANALVDELLAAKSAIQQIVAEHLGREQSK